MTFTISTRASIVIFCIVALLIFSAAFWLFLSFQNSPSHQESAVCEQVEEVMRDTSQEEWQGGKSYSIKNSLTDVGKSPLLLYIYDANQLIIQNKRYQNALRSSSRETLIGELYPEDFSYSDHISGFDPLFLVGADGWIYRCGAYK